MNRNIRFLRGTAKGINNNANEKLAPGQPLYNVTDRFLTVGADESHTVSNLHPISTNEVHGYFEKFKSDSNTPNYDYQLKISDDKDCVELKSKQNLLIDANDNLTVKSDTFNLTTTNDITVDSGEKSIVINDNLTIDKDGVINQIGALSGLSNSDDNSKPETIVAAINVVRSDLNTTINNLDYETTDEAVNKTLTAISQTDGKISTAFNYIELDSNNKINGKGVSDIFETDSATVKNATNAANVKTKDNVYKTLQGALLEMIYPVGSVYMSVKSTSPQSFLGGTWERIKDCYIHAAAEGINAEITGGSYNITTSQLPRHTHSLNGHTHSLNSHTHTLDSHTHGIDIEDLTTGGASKTLTANMKFRNFDDNNTTMFSSGNGMMTVSKLDEKQNTAAHNSTEQKVTQASFDASHTHNLSISGKLTGAAGDGYTGAADGSTGGSNADTSATGDSNEFRPKYIEMYVWKRIA